MNLMGPSPFVKWGGCSGDPTSKKDKKQDNIYQLLHKLKLHLKKLNKRPPPEPITRSMRSHPIRARKPPDKYSPPPRPAKPACSKASLGLSPANNEAMPDPAAAPGQSEAQARQTRFSRRTTQEAEREDYFLAHTDPHLPAGPKRGSPART